MKRFLIAALALTAVLATGSPAAAISGGTLAEPGEFPWAVRILPIGCGGTLIHPQLVLTAQHCVDEQEGDSFTIVSGAVDLDDPQRTTTRSTAIIGGTDWWDGPDWAVIRLEQPLDLPTVPLAAQPSDSLTVTVAGWGRQKWGEPQERFLRKVEMRSVSDEQCFDDPWWDENPEYPRATLCAGSDDQRSTCGGDSGGPAMHRLADGTWEQIGIVSAGSSCDWDEDEQARSNFTDIAYFRHDIQQAAERLLE